MTKYSVIFGFVLALTACSCKQANTKTTATAIQSENRLQFDTSLISILDYKDAQEILPRKAKSAQLYQNDFYSIDHLLKSAIEYGNVQMDALYEDYRSSSPNDHPAKDWFTIDIRKFKRQYIPFINENGDKEVWVICFRPDTVPERDVRAWKERPFPSHYGGHHAFRVRINMTRGSYSDFRTNGYG